MGRLIDIKWAELGIAIVAELADELNPDLCEEFWQNLPFKVLQAHPVVSGESLYAWAPMISTAPVQKTIRLSDCKVGDLRYSQKTGNKFSINYGKSTETLAQPFLGRVLPEYHHLLPVVGKEIWNNIFFQKELIFVEVEPHALVNPDPSKGDSSTDGRFGNLTSAVAAEFYTEAKRIQTVEPEDLRRIRLGEIDETGNYGQYFTAWDFTNGMLRDHIMYTAFNWIKYVDVLPHDALIHVIDTEDEPYSEYLGYSGLVTLRHFSLKLRSAIREAKDKEDARRLLQTFVMYGNRLCAWSYHYFPWHIGVFFRRQAWAQELPGRFRLCERSSRNSSE